VEGLQERVMVNVTVLKVPQHTREGLSLIRDERWKEAGRQSKWEKEAERKEAMWISGGKGHL